MKTIRETEPVDALGAAVMVAPARHAEQVRETPPRVCRWPTMAIHGLILVRVHHLRGVRAGPERSPGRR